MNAQQPAPTAVATARRPQVTDYKPLQELTVSQLLEDPRVMQAMAESAPKHLSPQRLLRVMAQALRKTPKLGQCHPLSLLGAMITCASLGLEPNTPLGHCYLIPFEKRAKRGKEWVTESVEVNLIIGYQGLIDLSRRTGSLVSIHADVVYEGDEFSFEYGSNMHLRHVPVGDRESRKPLYAYAHSKLEDGEAFEVLPYASILRARDATQAYKQAMASKDRGDRYWATTPWVAYEHEMACKTMVRRLSKWLPRSIEFAAAEQLDSLAERGLIDFKAIAQQPQLASDPQMATIEEQPTPPAEDTPAKAKLETGAAPKPAAPEPPLSEADEREADRMTRSVMEGGKPNDEASGDDFDTYLDKMADEVKNAATSAIAAETNATFRDAVLGAADRKEITEARGNELLGKWSKIYQAPKPAGGKKG